MNEALLLRRIDEGIERLHIPERGAEVVRLKVQGLTRKEIGYQLGISENTVKWHIVEAYNRTGASTGVQLVRALLGASIVEE